MNSIEDEIIRILNDEKSFDDILKEISDNFCIELNYGQYALVSSTIRSFLSYMYEEETIEYKLVKNKMFWKSKSMY